MSGPDTSGSLGLNGIPLTNDAPEETTQLVIFIITTYETQKHDKTTKKRK